MAQSALPPTLITEADARNKERKAGKGNNRIQDSGPSKNIRKHGITNMLLTKVFVQNMYKKKSLCSSILVWLSTLLSVELRCEFNKRCKRIFTLTVNY